MNIAPCYYRFKDEAHAGAMVATISDTDGNLDAEYEVVRLGPRSDQTGPRSEYILAVLNRQSVLPVEGWEQWHIPSDRVAHTWAGLQDEQEAVDELATDIDETAPITDTVPSRKVLTAELREIRAEKIEAFAIVVSLRAYRDAYRKRLDRELLTLNTLRDERSKINAEIKALRDNRENVLVPQREAADVIIKNSDSTGPEKKSVVDQITAGNADIDAKVIEVKALRVEVDSQDAVVDPMQLEIADINANLVAERAILTTKKLDLQARRDALENA